MIENIQRYDYLYKSNFAFTWSYKVLNNHSSILLIMKKFSLIINRVTKLILILQYGKAEAVK